MRVLGAVFRRRGGRRRAGRLRRSAWRNINVRDLRGMLRPWRK